MFDFSNIAISDDDISKVENRFGFKFNPSQVNLIRHWESADIQACPGSGKTTTLAAKLILLSEKIPNAFSQGICIITHTNIAVEEIKAKLGDSAKFFFQYPNHFGTIQSFVDKFLAIPFYKNLYKHSPKIVDEYDYDHELRNVPPLRQNGTLTYLDYNNIFLGGLSFNKHNFALSSSINDEAQWMFGRLTAPVMKKYYDRILNAKTKLLSDGYLKYDEAYALAFRYIKEHPSIINIVRQRFPMVFVDEMQDMEQHQQEMISTLFGSKSILQKIGDINQSIFSSSVQEGSSKWAPVMNPALALSHSNRLSDHLANMVSGICCSPQNMTGWSNPDPIKPVLFVYDDHSILQIKDEFAKKIISNGLHKKGNIKVVGSRIGDSRLNINSYWPDFNRNYKRNDYPNLVTFLSDLKQATSSAINVKVVRKELLNCVCSCLKKNKVKSPLTGFYFTPFTFLSYLEVTGNSEKILKIDQKITHWILRMRKSETIYSELVSFIKAVVAFFDSDITDDLKTFLDNTEVEIPTERPEMKIYEYTNGEFSVPLHFDTIHGVKGETHTATLYLETFNRIFDIGGKILTFIISDVTQRANIRKKDKACYKKLPHAYVAITRATDFFALTVHKSRFSAEHKTYFENDDNQWEVIYTYPPERP